MYALTLCSLESKMLPESSPDLAARWQKLFRYDYVPALQKIGDQYPDIETSITKGMHRCCSYYADRSSVETYPPVVMPFFEYPEGTGRAYRSLAESFFSATQSILEKTPDAGIVRGCDGVSLELAASYLSRHMGVIPLIPNFYLTPRRSDLGWHVAPLARQTEFGLVFATENEQVDKAVSARVSEQSKIGISSTIKVGVIEGTGSLFADIITSIASVGGKLYCRDGYIQNELVLELLRKAPNLAALSAFAEVWETITLPDEGSSPIFPYTADGGKIDSGAEEFKRSALVFDIGNVDVLGRTMERLRASDRALSYQIYKIRHDVNVPVGIGFTDLALPYLLHEESDGKPNLLRMRDSALDCFFVNSPGDWLKHLSEHGLSFRESESARIEQARRDRGGWLDLADNAAQEPTEDRAENRMPPVNIGLGGPTVDLVAWVRFVKRALGKRN